MDRPWGETIEVKFNIVQKLKSQLQKNAKGVFGVGTVTDPYQSLEKKFELTRGCLVALKSAGAQISVLTKSDLILRDLDVLRAWQSAEVGISIASLDGETAALLEPGAPSPDRRLDALRRLSAEGVRTYLMAAPIIRGVTDSEEGLRGLVRRSNEAGVRAIMWDKFNPKPMATSRLRKRLVEKGFSQTTVHSNNELTRIRSVLGSECEKLGLELLDAF